MRSVWFGVSLTSLALLWASSSIFAHEGHVHTSLGTVERIEKTRLDVKDADGKPVSFALTEQTVLRRGEKSILASELKVGERVAIEFEDGPTVKMAVRVRVGAAQQATTYTCPMHPEVVSDKPGKCPKCGMTLEPKAKKP